MDEDEEPQVQASDASTVDGADATATAADRAVDAARARLSDLDDADVSAHPEIYADIHRSLSAALDDEAEPTPSDE